jgi:cysteine synthase B
MQTGIEPSSGIDQARQAMNVSAIGHNKRTGGYSSILELVGNTPLVRINNITPGKEGVEIYAKLEWFNPGGSVKDRAALGMIEDAEASGALTKDKTIIDSTSGNTGVAYALVGAVKGYSVELVMPSNVTMERKRTIGAFKAKIVYSDPLEGSDGARMLALQMLKDNPEKYYLPCQYDNASNWKAHYHTTGVEIYHQTEGRVTHFVAGIGTGGTLMGVGKRLKDYDPSIQVMAVEPDNPMHGIEGLKHMASSLVPGIYDESFPDGKISVNTEDAYAMADRLTNIEGLFAGHSSGAAMVGALEVAKRIQRGVIVVLFPDGGDRYLSTGF